MLYPNTCVIFDSTAGNVFSAINCDRYEAACKNLCHFVEVVHSDSGQDAKPGKIYLTTSQVLDEPVHRKDASRGIRPGNCDLKLLRATRDLPHHELYVRIEWDVVPTGDLVQAMSDLVRFLQGTDFAASSFRQRHPACNWVWWKTLDIPDTAAERVWTEARGALLPIMAVSSRYISGYQHLLEAGWRGHYEVTMPTAARMLGFNSVDLSKDPYYFTHYPQFTFDSVADLDRFIPRFIHPVKSQAGQDFLEAQLQSIRTARAV